MARFLTLLQREWFQHRTAWLVLMAVPAALALLVLGVARLQLSVDDVDLAVQAARLSAPALASAAIIGTAVVSFLLAWFSALVQAPGLARRDHGNRSVEFWLSLPVGHVQALAAPLLAHLLLFPLAALGVGCAAGHLVSLLVVTRVHGVEAWVGLPWGAIEAAALATGLRTALGLLLATLWLAPLIGLLMAASAWLRRWGLPALVAGLALLSQLLQGLVGSPVIWNVGQELLAQAGKAFVTGRAGGGLRFRPGEDSIPLLQALPAWAAGDAWAALQALASPLLPLGLAVAAACFGLLVLRRRQGA